MERQILRIQNKTVLRTQSQYMKPVLSSLLKIQERRKMSISGYKIYISWRSADRNGLSGGKILGGDSGLIFFNKVRRFLEKFFFRYE